MAWQDEIYPETIRESMVSSVMEKGKGIQFLELLMEETREEDHLLAIVRPLYGNYLDDLDPSFHKADFPYSTFEKHMKADENVLFYGKAEVEHLIRFPKNWPPNEEGMALIEYLLRLPSLMDLTDVQLLELEALLNKAGKSLGIELPVLYPADETQQKEGLNTMLLSVLQEKPIHFYKRYVAMMLAAGTPVTMTKQEFFQLAEENLRP